jgi:NIPSNAP protein
MTQKPEIVLKENVMIVDLRTYTMVPGRLNAWLKLYEAEGMPIHIRHLGEPMGIFTTDAGVLNQVVFFWRFADQADRERRRAALEADPDWASYRKKSAEAGNVQHQENKIIKATAFSPG